MPDSLYFFRFARLATMSIVSHCADLHDQPAVPLGPSHWTVTHAKLPINDKLNALTTAVIDDTRTFQEQQTKILSFVV